MDDEIERERRRGAKQIVVDTNSRIYRERKRNGGGEKKRK